MSKKKLKEGFEMMTCLWQEIIQKIICNNSKHCRLTENEEHAWEILDSEESSELNAI